MPGMFQNSREASTAGTGGVRTEREAVRARAGPHHTALGVVQTLTFILNEAGSQWRVQDRELM